MRTPWSGSTWAQRGAGTSGWRVNTATDPSAGAQAPAAGPVPGSAGSPSVVVVVSGAGSDPAGSPAVAAVTGGSSGSAVAGRPVPGSETRGRGSSPRWSGSAG